MKAAAAFAIVNFVWQGAVIGAIAWLGFALSRSPRIRYLIGVGALASMAFAPVVTGVIFARASEVHGPTSMVHGSLSSQVLGATSGRLDLGRGTVDVREPWTMDRGRWTLPAIPLDPRVAPFVVAVWMIGVVALSARLAVGFAGARRLTRRVSEAGMSVQVVANRLTAMLRIRATVLIVESALVQVPAVIGAFKPMVLLPVAAMTGLSMEQVEALLAHELAHVRRHDYLVNLFQSAIETLLFYHPAVWLVSRRVRQERELCCDDLALAVCADRVAYASALADLESLRATPSPALAATGGSLLSRIRRILGHDEVSALAGRSKSVAGIAILAAIILLAGGQAARAGSGRAERSPTPPQVSHTQRPTQGVVAGVQGGVKGGVTTGVTGGVTSGVAGGVPNGVSEAVARGVQGGVQRGVPDSVPMLVSADDDPMLKVLSDADITVRVKSNGKPVKQFADRPLHVDKDGTVMLPLLGRFQIGGRTLRESAASIRGELIFRKFFPDPQVDVRANMQMFPAVIQPPASSPSAQATVPDSYIVRLGDELSIAVASPVAQPQYSGRTYKVQPDGSISLPGLVQPLKIVGFTIKQSREAVRTALINAGQYANPTVDVNLVGYKPSDLVVVSAEPMDDSTPPITAGQVVRLECVVGIVRQAEFNKDYTVQPDGTIVVPYLGPTRAAGLTTKDLGGVIAGELNATKTLPGARVTASIETRQAAPPPPPAPKGISVIVQGAVRTPGSLMLREDRNSLSDALAAAGGLQTTAGSRIFVKRLGSPDVTYSRDAIVQAHQVVRIQDGDVIAVEVAPHFYVTGYVKNSSSEYNWEPGMTLQKAIAMAGGLTPDAAGSRIEIQRKDPKTGKFAAVKLDKDPMSTPILGDDVIKVPKKRM